MSVTEIQLFQILKNKLGEKEAQTLVTFVKKEVRAEFDGHRDSLATKEDIFLVREDMAKLRSELTKSIYTMGLVQFLAIVGSVLMIFTFMLK